MNTPGYAYFCQTELNNHLGSRPQKVSEQGGKAGRSTANADRKGLPVEKMTGVMQSSQMPGINSGMPVSHSVDSARVEPLTQKKPLTINEIESQLDCYRGELHSFLLENDGEIGYYSSAYNYFDDKDNEIYQKLSDNGFGFDSIDEFNRMDSKVKHVIRSYNAFSKLINDSKPYNALTVYDKFLLPQKGIHPGVEKLPDGHSPYNGSQLKYGYIRKERSSSFGSAEKEKVITRNFKAPNRSSFLEKNSGSLALSIRSSSSDAEKISPKYLASLPSLEKTTANIYDESEANTIIYKGASSNKLNDAEKKHAVGHDINSDDAVVANCSERSNISAPVIAAWERVLSSKGKNNGNKGYKLKSVTIYENPKKEKDSKGIIRIRTDREQVLQRIGPALYKLKCEYDRFENDFHTFFTSRDYRLNKDNPDFVMVKEKLDALRIKLKRLNPSHLGYDETRLQKHLLNSLRKLSIELDSISGNAINSNMLRL